MRELQAAFVIFSCLIGTPAAAEIYETSAIHCSDRSSFTEETYIFQSGSSGQYVWLVGKNDEKFPLQEHASGGVKAAFLTPNYFATLDQDLKLSKLGFNGNVSILLCFDITDAAVSVSEDLGEIERLSVRISTLNRELAEKNQENDSLRDQILLLSEEVELLKQRIEDLHDISSYTLRNTNADPRKVPDYLRSMLDDQVNIARYGALVEYLRIYEPRNGDCFAALPLVVSKRKELEIVALGSLPEDTAGLAKSIEQATGISVSVSTHLVSNSQCEPLRLTSSLFDYPVFPVNFELERREIPNGGTLGGMITHVGSSQVHLLLIDDEGLVQDLSPFLVDRGSEKVFSIGPLRANRSQVSLKQLLLVLSTPNELPSLNVLSRGALEATNFFSLLSEDLVSTNQSGVGLAIEAFSVGNF